VIERALGDARTVVNVGAGVDRLGRTGRALPFDDESIDAATAILTLHHWGDPLAGLGELRRVARGPVVVLTFDPEASDSFWLVRDYLPEIAAIDRARFPAIAETVAALGGATVDRVPIPHDCRDGFLGAFWRRPERYLEPAVRPGISNFAEIDPAVLEPALARLRNDVDSGAWRRRYGGLLSRDELDVGYRLVVSLKK
jgi:SAM-dependent methyltransferase